MENKFEKDVRKKLDGLKFSPSDLVWGKVAKHLEQRQRRKVAFWWLIFPGLFLLSGSIYYFNYNTAKQTENIVVSQSAHPNAGSVTTQSSKNIKTGEVDSSHFSETATFHTTKRKSIIHKGSVKKSLIDANTEQKVVSAIPNGNKREAARSRNDKGNTEHIFMPAGSNQSTALSQKAIPAGKSENIRLSTFTIDPVLLPHEIDSVITHLDLPRKQIQVLSQNAPAGDKIVSKTDGWQFNVVFTPGSSFLSRSTSKNSTGNTVANDPVYMRPGSISNQWNAPQQIFSTPVYSSGFSFNTGFNVGRQFSRRLVVSSGLLYYYYSINSRSSVFDRTINVTTENHSKNNFNFIELPLQLKINSLLGNVKAIWQTGLSFSYLLASQSLQDNGVISKSNSEFNRLQTGINAGVNFQLLHSGNLSLGIGPFYQYNFMNLANSGLFLDHHLHFAGIKTEVNFKK